MFCCTMYPQMQRLPPLKSSNLLLDVLTGNDTKLTIEEALGSKIPRFMFYAIDNCPLYVCVYVGSADGRLPLDIHTAIDKKLNMD